MWNPKDPLDSIDPILGFVEHGVNARHFNTVPTSMPTFRRMVVLDVITDPRLILGQDNRKIEYYREVLGVDDFRYVNVLPRNTIVAQEIRSNKTPMFVLPFFSSHLSLPCKPGEVVWAIIEDPDIQSDIAYWVCRTPDLHNADDVNHTHPSRNDDPSLAGIDRTSKVQRTQNDGKTVPIYELRNGPVKIEHGIRKTDVTKLLVLNNDEEYFEKLVTQTDASRLLQYEAIPRFRKRPGDIVLEGTNNSLIVLGTDRQSSASDYSSDVNNIYGPVPSFPASNLTGSAGSIDLVVGRGQTSNTLGLSAITTSIFGATKDSPGLAIDHNGLPKRELAKAEDQLSNEEGDLDLKNDRSRIQISQRTNVDKNLSIDSFNDEEFSVQDANNGDAAIVIKTDKIRLVARSDIELLVTGFNEIQNSEGLTIKDENSEDNNEKFAAIIIKSNGDIIFRPSDTGFIKLGDDTADKALLCTDFPATLLNGEVSPATPPLLNTMGGKFGGTGIPTQGTWASKILVTGGVAPLPAG